MAKRRPWLNDVLRLMDERAYTSPELAELMQARHRSGPCAKEVTLVLKRDSRFRLVCESTTASLMRNSSHVVPVFGLADANYELTAPFRRL
jgi:hypothetical protein